MFWENLCHTFHSWCAVHLKTGCQDSQGIHETDASLCNYSSYIRAQSRKCHLPICSIIWIKSLQYLLPKPVCQENSCALIGNVQNGTRIFRNHPSATMASSKFVFPFFSLQFALWRNWVIALLNFTQAGFCRMHCMVLFNMFLQTAQLSELLL